MYLEAHLLYFVFGFDVIFYGLYMLGGDIMLYVYVFFIVSCFTYGTLIIDLYYEVILGICFLFLCFVKSRRLNCFTCIFHTCVYVFVECFRNLQINSVVDTVYFSN